MVFVLLADGFEELEALSVVDILRRGNVDIKTAGITKTVTGANGIPVVADMMISEIDEKNISAIVLPGGLPGADNLYNNDRVRELITYANDNGLIIGAICAAPYILGKMGILNGKRATCYPGFENALEGAYCFPSKAVSDGNIITGKGPGAAYEFAYMLLEKMSSRAVADKIKRSMQYE